MNYQSAAIAGALGLGLVSLGLLGASFIIAHNIGKAARMKNRSYRAFFWLSILMSPITTGLVVAAIPFNPYDSRSPLIDSDAEAALPERFLNPYAEDKLFTSTDALVVAVCSGTIFVGLLVFVFEISRTGALLNS